LSNNLSVFIPADKPLTKRRSEPLPFRFLSGDFAAGASGVGVIA
jgi:hypothetical protein